MRSADEDNDRSPALLEPALQHPDAVASLAGVCLRLGDRPILDGIDLVLTPASIYVLLGLNGAGKTTLMRTLCGRLRPDRGQVRVLGRDPRRDATVRRAVGWVPQSVALYPSLTVRENLVAFAALRNCKSPGRIDQVLRAVRMEATAERLVCELSGGFQRRANLAAALVSAPSLLLLDEPTVGLDLAAKEAVIDIIRSEARTGTSILLATHDFDVAAAADRVGFLARGKIVAEGRPCDLLSQHFGTRVRVGLQLGGSPRPKLVARLSAAGLVFSPEHDIWSAPPEGLAPTRLDDVLAAVAVEGCAIRSLTVESPGLKELYDVLTKRAA